MNARDPAQVPTPAGAVTVRRLDARDARERIDALADILIECVEGGASVTFLRPLSREKSLAFWRTVADAVARRERVLLVAEDTGGRVVGTVQLVLSVPENQPHRAEVAKMLVRPSARRQGIAQRLMASIDQVAHDEGRTVLVLDTVTGSDAERLYQRSGWQRVGVIPQYALDPDGAFCAATFFYKQL